MDKDIFFISLAAAMAMGVVAYLLDRFLFNPPERNVEDVIIDRTEK